MRALVVGAGIGGLAAAGALAKNGWETTVLEQATAPRTAGYMIDFFGPGFAAAESLGAIAHLQRRGELYSRACYVDQAGRTRAKFAMESFLNAAHGKFFSILRPDIEMGLREWVGDSVGIVQGARVVSVDPGRCPGAEGPGDPARAVVADGRDFEADLLIGADGIHSTVRGAMPALPATGVLRHLGLHVFGYVFYDPELAASLGRDVVLTDSLVRQATLYALSDGRVTFFGVIECDDPDPDPDTREELFTKFRGLGSNVDRALDQRPAEIFEDVVAQAVVPAWSAGRCVLLGDAAFAVSLLAGQGASLAIAGAKVLADALGSGNDIPAALAGYESSWRPLVEQQQEAGRRNARFFVPADRRALLLRRWSLHLMNLAPVNAVIARRVFGASVVGKGHPTP
ncbi:FAD-dependent monooxygenase [Paeniglutamicibacter psychrophenolicus]|uniref:FAD-dependent monooxygenase n=1 Tax=Paeniglutamicibacter psychrophenolicus TaxID=257454 RepID=UPI002787DD11|nr:FAD-dependent monooxygenase [Paeniglutamicibacter psychrophenolicus]MDQ0095251.1 2-polyprenyl-6-methoxyphenol hydroxylase-like FAD-dependent oxidoreductase [Paeniglutamicibacter psychrophenolicus]